MNGLVDFMKSNGFSKKVYQDQIGSPVFFTKTFSEEEIPEFMSQFNDDEPDESPGDITLEISEDGEILQYCCSDSDYYDSINPRMESESAKAMLALFGIHNLEDGL